MSERRRIVAWEWAPGQSALESMLGGGGAESVAEACAAALAEMHKAHAPLREAIEPADLIAGTRSGAAELATLDPGLGQEAGLLADHLRRALADQGPERCVIHGDFSPEHVSTLAAPPYPSHGIRARSTNLIA